MLTWRAEVLISLLIYQALYPVEMEALTVADINLDAGTIYIKATAKTNRRELALKPNQILLFYHYLQQIRGTLLGAKKNDNLLIGQRGQRAALPEKDCGT